MADRTRSATQSDTRSVAVERDAVIHVYDDAGTVIETHEKGTNLNKFRHQRKAKDNVVPLSFDQVVGWSFTHLVS